MSNLTYDKKERGGIITCESGRRYIILKTADDQVCVISADMMKEDVRFDRNSPDYKTSELKQVMETEILPMVEKDFGAENIIEHKAYTEADITAKKGTYQYWLDSVQIAPQNAINEQATRYMLFFFTALMDEYGFGKERLTRVEEYLNSLLLDYQQDKTFVRAWKIALMEEAGVFFEMPIDPLTQTAGSLMTN